MKSETLQVLYIGADGEDLPLTWLVDRATTAAEGLDRLANVQYDAVLVVAPVDQMPIDALIEALLSLRRNVPVVICDRSATLADAVRYTQLGAYDVAGPADDTVAKMQTAAEACQTTPVENVSEPWRQMLVGNSAAMRRTAA